MTEMQVPGGEGPAPGTAGERPAGERAAEQVAAKRTARKRAAKASTAQTGAALKRTRATTARGRATAATAAATRPPRGRKRTAAKAQPPTVTEETAARKAAAEQGAPSAGLLYWANVSTPLGRLQVPVPNVAAAPQVVLAPTARAVHAARGVAPSRERLAYYGGLGLMAALGVIEWPVAAALGAGVWVATHAKRVNGSQAPEAAGRAPSARATGARAARRTAANA